MVRKQSISKQRYSKRQRKDLGRSDGDIEEIRDLEYQSGQRTNKVR